MKMILKNVRSLIFAGLILSVSFGSSAQNKLVRSQIDYKIKVPADSTFEVEFSTDKMIHNLLVTVFDNKGQLVFMDCQYNFSGPYKKSIALRQPVKNGYFLKIANDAEIFEKKLSTD